jgi:NADPH:quinone reductase-like Zn-dependent oxidoreductase
MKAIVLEEYGRPEVLRSSEIDQPVAGDHEVLIRVHAVAVNPGDWDVLHGTPYVLRPATGILQPRNPVLGLAVAGVVEATGSRVSSLNIGDEVFAGIAKGGFAEFACAPDSATALMPSNLTFLQAAAVPVSGTTALQALRDVARVEPGQRVLINGAAGGVGTFAVQIAKAFGAEVTGVCSADAAELVFSIGADDVIDYTREDFTDREATCDVILDNIGNRSLSDLRRALAPKGMLIPNSNKGGGRWFGTFLPRAIQALAVSMLASQKLRPFAATEQSEDLAELGGLIEAGKVKPVIDRVYSLDETPAAIAYYGQGHAHGKVVVAIEHE